MLKILAQLEKEPNYSSLQSFFSELYNQIQECFSQEIDLIVKNSSFKNSTPFSWRSYYFQNEDKYEIHFNVNFKVISNLKLNKIIFTISEDIIKSLEISRVE